MKFALEPGERMTPPVEGARPCYQRNEPGQRGGKPWSGYWVSYDGESWSLWCPCVEAGRPLCDDWNPEKRAAS